MKAPETPLPRETDTGAPSWLTSVGSPEPGQPRNLCRSSASHGRWNTSRSPTRGCGWRRSSVWPWRWSSPRSPGRRSAHRSG